MRRRPSDRPKQAKDCKRCDTWIEPGEDCCVWAPHMIVDLCDECLDDMKFWIKQGPNR